MGGARRQSLGIEDRGVRVLDDFAHHPTAVRLTLEGLREADVGRLWAIFEPRSATSSRAVFQSEYAQAFAAAHEVIVAQVGRPEIPEDERLNPTRLAEELSQTGPRGRHLAAVDAIVRTVVAEARAGDTVVIMSNGGFGGIHSKLAQALKART